MYVNAFAVLHLVIIHGNPTPCVHIVKKNVDIPLSCTTEQIPLHLALVLLIGNLE